MTNSSIEVKTEKLLCFFFIIIISFYSIHLHKKISTTHHHPHLFLISYPILIITFSSYLSICMIIYVPHLIHLSHSLSNTILLKKIFYLPRFFFVLILLFILSWILYLMVPYGSGKQFLKEDERRRKKIKHHKKHIPWLTDIFHHSTFSNGYCFFLFCLLHVSSLQETIRLKILKK